MKVAYTINGLIGGFSGKNSTISNKDDDYIILLEYFSKLINKYITSYNDVDFFIFSWHTEIEDKFNKYLSPKKIKLKPQIDFEIPEHLKYGNIGRVLAHKSRWYGFKEVMNMVWEYEVDNSFKYDLVVNVRFDICWNKPFKFDKLDINQFHIPMHPDRSNYGWPDEAPEILDHIFVSNSDWMRHYSTLFDFIDEYTLPGECPQWNTISNHFLMVWHLRKLGLLSVDTVKKSFTTLTDNNIKIIGRCEDTEIDYDIFRYRQLSREDVLSYEQ